MAVPANKAAYLVNTVGGAFTSQVQGGTILGNGSVGSVITKAFELLTAVDNDKMSYGPVETAYPVGSGMYGTQKCLAGGTFAYFEAGKYIIRTVSTSISGVASDKVLIPGSNSSNTGSSIMRFKHAYGARLLTKWRANEFSWLGVLDDGTSIGRRFNWVNAAGNAAEAPATATDLNMWNPESAAAEANSDSAANPTRAIPGELVMKVDFVNTDISTSGDFFDYKPITGM
jgi:hypothetical protein